ncbi:hypothetical protein BpHYR1_028656 [Brachionus plicatilis]|uniref:Menorin-like domain-containing protein n=1 Tax=Brachionus plicatilis TaxID=10195 RepID=A0A3M7RWH5_BRAPC|nr:hypothetical protein BpHYR1_028656 [Brachionus plicatilis]
MLDFFQVEDASLITWSHAVNNRAKLLDSLKSECHFIEADIVFDAEKHDEPIMAHPPLDHSDLTFREFVQKALTCAKGLKLDFKSQDSIRPCLAYLNTMDLALPVILNADIFQGSNSPQVKIDADMFVRTCTAEYPRGVLSLGWTTRPSSHAAYTWQNVQQAADICERFRLSNVHFAVRLAWSVRSIDKLVRLHELTNCSFTIWSHDSDKLASCETLLLFRHFFDEKFMFYDLPVQLISYLSMNKNEYRTILQKSSDHLIRSYVLDEKNGFQMSILVKKVFDTTSCLVPLGQVQKLFKSHKSQVIGRPSEGPIQSKQINGSVSFRLGNNDLRTLWIVSSFGKKIVRQKKNFTDRSRPVYLLDCYNSDRSSSDERTEDRSFFRRAVQRPVSKSKSIGYGKSIALDSPRIHKFFDMKPDLAK